MSEAMTAGEGQRATTSRKDEICAMDGSIGQPVLNCKPVLSHDYGEALRNTCPMSDGSTEYLEAFTTRVYSAREHAGLTQQDVAHVLKTTQTAYSKYEGRSLMPHRHIRSFCLACHVSVDWLITGQGKGVTLLDKPDVDKRRGRRRTRKAA